MTNAEMLQKLVADIEEEYNILARLEIYSDTIILHCRLDKGNGAHVRLDILQFLDTPNWETVLAASLRHHLAEPEEDF